MKTKQLIPALLIGVSLNALSQHMPPGPPPDIIVMSLDKDHDHELSKREIKNAARSLGKLDEDRDDALSAEELQPEPPDGKKRKNDDAENQTPPPAPPPSALMSAIDTDGDGTLSKEEIESAPESLAKLDQDGDGKITYEEESDLGDPDEENSGPPPGGGGGPPGGGPPRR